MNIKNLLSVKSRSGGVSRRSEATSASGIALDEGGAGGNRLGAGGASRRSEATSASGIALDEGGAGGNRLGALNSPSHTYFVQGLIRPLARMGEAMKMRTLL